MYMIHNDHEFSPGATIVEALSRCGTIEVGDTFTVFEGADDLYMNVRTNEVCSAHPIKLLGEFVAREWQIKEATAMADAR